MKKLMMIVLAATLLVSCGKDEEEKPITYPDYSNLKVGNYWVYQHFFIDTTGAETALDEYDSCYIEKDTLVNGNTYFKMFRPRKTSPIHFNIYLWRDSLGYVVDTSGKIWFAPEDFTTIFDTQYNLYQSQDTVYTATSRMADRDSVITTPAGDYTTRTFQVRYDMGDVMVGVKTPRFSNTRYALNVGIVSQTLEFYASMPTYEERRLVRYGNVTSR